MNFDLYHAAIVADADYQAELVRVYGKDACERRYQSADHDDPRVQAARERKYEADRAWLAEVRNHV